MSDIKDLTGQAAIKKMQELIDKVRVCMFCTKLISPPFTTRPMSTLKVDDDGILWFFSSKKSIKNSEINTNSQVELIYSNEDNSEFATIYGYAEIIENRAKAKELWTPFAKAWFELGPDDPDLSIIKITPQKGHYWDTKYGKMVTMTRIALAAVLGVRMEEAGVEGMLMS